MKQHLECNGTPQIDYQYAMDFISTDQIKDEIKNFRAQFLWQLKSFDEIPSGFGQDMQFSNEETRKDESDIARVAE